MRRRSTKGEPTHNGPWGLVGVDRRCPEDTTMFDIIFSLLGWIIATDPEDPQEPVVRPNSGMIILPTG